MVGSINTFLSVTRHSKRDIFVFYSNIICLNGGTAVGSPYGCTVVSIVIIMMAFGANDESDNQFIKKLEISTNDEAVLQ